MHALFRTLVPLFGIGFWTSALQPDRRRARIPAAFATSRAMRLSVVASGSAALVAVLWALFYNRVMQGAELTFSNSLLAALAA
jgi:hypothetical protein